jgi:hypothetical protein
MTACSVRFATQDRVIGPDIRLGSRRKEPSPAPHDVLVQPSLGDLGVKPQQQVQMIIHH